MCRFLTIKSSTSNKNIESLSSLLEKLKIEKIGEKLEAEDIDLESLTMLKEDDLKVCIRNSNLERFYFLFFIHF